MNTLTRACAAVAVSAALHASLFAIRVDTPHTEAPRAITVSLRAVGRPGPKVSEPARSEPSPPTPNAGAQKTAHAPAPSPARQETPRPAPKKRDSRPKPQQPRHEAAHTTPQAPPANEPAPLETHAAPAGTSPSGTAASTGSSAARPISTVGGGAGEIRDVETLSVVRRVVPEYPVMSRRRRDEGTAVVVVTIEAGRVTSAVLERSSGSGALDSAAVDAARRWRFDSASGALRARIPFVFKLR